MRSLREVIDEVGEDYDYKFIVPDFTAVLNGHPVVVQAILNRTAIVHPVGKSDPDSRRVINLSEIKVRPHSIKWEERSANAARLRRSVRRGNIFNTSIGNFPI